MDYFDRILGAEEGAENNNFIREEKDLGSNETACTEPASSRTFEPLIQEPTSSRTFEPLIQEPSSPRTFEPLIQEPSSPRTFETLIKDVESSKGHHRSRKGFGLDMFISILCIFVLIPATFIICLRAGDKRLYIGSIIIMFLAMAPFFLRFEHRKPNPRELVTIAVLTAVAVISRVAFMWLPAFKPMAGIIVISAMCMGPQAGFMSGALSMLISNIIFGQGPWTPWQMFCYGMIGFLGGLMAKPGILSEKHLIRSGIITFFTVTILSSVILDSSTLFFMFSKISRASIITVYIAGLPMNVLNGLASALAVALLSRPISIIINRIKTKYGIQP